MNDAPPNPEPATLMPESPCQQGGGRRRRPPTPWLRPIPFTLAVSIGVAGVWGAYQRIGTTTDVETVEIVPNLSGGFLAVGLSEDRPGFVLFSSLDPKEVDVEVQRADSPLGGRYATLFVHLGERTWRHRLRGPIAVIVGPDETVRAYPVSWSLDDLRAMQEAADCAHVAAGKRVHRCGMPFDDVRDVVSAWPRDRVPDPIRTFLRKRGHLDE
ncbi:MAG: hypothetical protein D6788_01125 [Planctomycetota bacterium]|nr:MAG: hypothetical protein D6788_01125 [Planctomycetota bacterium]